MAIGDIAMVSGREVAWTDLADVLYTDYTFTSGTQYTFYTQPAAQDVDIWVVEIITPFAHTLPGTVLLDIGTAGTPQKYILGFDLTAVAGTYTFGVAIGSGDGMNSLVATTDIKAKLTYVGSLTAGEFKLYGRCSQVKS